MHRRHVHDANIKTGRPGRARVAAAAGTGARGADTGCARRNLENQTRKEAIQEINWAEWSPFEYSKCTECQFLPLCMCGCPYTLYDNNSTEPICVEWKYITDYFVVEKIKEAIINEQD